jgi:hypothetical protein
MEDIGWRKSSYSAENGGECVEVGTVVGADRVLVRDTKDRSGLVLAFGAEAWRHLVIEIKGDTV